LHVTRELFGIVSWQLDAELVPEFSDGGNADGAIEVDMEVNFGELLEVHGR
jgi:hypothetical protein